MPRCVVYDLYVICYQITNRCNNERQEENNQDYLVGPFSSGSSSSRAISPFRPNSPALDDAAGRVLLTIS